MSTILLSALIAILVLQLIFLLILSSFGITLFFGSPWVPTHRNRARKMLEFVNFRHGETILDLGCGDGAILFCAIEEFGAKKAYGLDINPILVARGKLRSRLRGNTSLVELRRGNMFTSPLPRVDVVASFLIPSSMKRLRERFARDLAPDTRIVSRGFAIPGVVPLSKREGPDEWLYLYRAGDLSEKLPPGMV